MFGPENYSASKSVHKSSITMLIDGINPDEMHGRFSNVFQNVNDIHSNQIDCEKNILKPGMASDMKQTNCHIPPAF